jgi:pilus assembly protein CpaB
MFRSLRRPLPRIGRLPRLLLAGTCLLLALSSALGARHRPPAPAHTAGVVVAARDLPAGHRLARRDVSVLRWPAALRPNGALAAPAAVVGRRLAGPVAAHEPITAPRMVGADLASGLRPGLVAAPVTLGDPHTVDLVRAGDYVDLLEAAATPEFVDAAQQPTPAVRSVADDVLVLAALPATNDAAAELIVAVAPQTAMRMTRDAATHVFTAVVRPA